MSDGKKHYFLRPRNAMMFLFVVIAFALVVAPSISTSLMGTAAAAKAPTTSAAVITTAASLPHLMIQKDALGSKGSNTNPGNANDQNNNNTETTTPTNPTTHGEKHFLIIGSSRQFTLKLSAQGTMMPSTNVNVDGTINGIAELNPDNSIARIAQDSLSGSMQVTDTDGNILATMDLSSLHITVKATKVSVASDFTDQDNDRGKFTASLYASDNIVAPDVGESGSADLSNDNNQLSIVYNTANQRVTAADGDVSATLDFPA